MTEIGLNNMGDEPMSVEQRKDAVEQIVKELDFRIAEVARVHEVTAKPNGTIRSFQIYALVDWLVEKGAVMTMPDGSPYHL